MKQRFTTANGDKDRLHHPLIERAKGTFWEYLGCEIVTAEPRKVVLKLEVKPHHLNLFGIVHGGVLSSLLDNAMGIATLLAYPDYNVFTSNLNIHFVAPLQTDELRITADIIYETRRSMTCTGQVFAADGQLGSLATATFRLVTKQ